MSRPARAAKVEPNPACSGCSLRGHWRGYPCGARAGYKTRDGRRWCGAHYAVALQSPGRFDEARAAVSRRRSA